MSDVPFLWNIPQVVLWTLIEKKKEEKKNNSGLSFDGLFSKAIS